MDLGEAAQMASGILSAMGASARLPARGAEPAGLRAQRCSLMDYHRGTRKTDLQLSDYTWLISALLSSGSTKSGGAPSQLTAAIMASLMESGDLQQHITGTLQPAYEQRYQSMIFAIEKHLIPLGVTMPEANQQEVAGGYFIWVSLPPSLNADQVTSRAKKEENLIVAPGTLFGVHGDAMGQGLESKLRLCYAYEDKNLLAEGIERLGNLIDRMN